MSTNQLKLNENDQTTSSTISEYDEIRSLLEDVNNSQNGNEDVLGQFMGKLTEKYGISRLEELMNPIEKGEPILDPRNQKFTAFPIKYNKIWDLYKAQLACFWKPEAIKFSGDYDDFMTMSKDEQHFVEMILAFFAASDGIVNFNLGERFIREVQITEAQIAYGYQMMMESIHSEVYSLMLDNIVRNPERRNFLFNAIQTVPSVKMMADWAFKWIDSSQSFAHRVVAFAIVEGVFFSGAFASIFWIKNYKNTGNNTDSKGHIFMEGLIQSNDYIARDEGQHVELACEMYTLINKRLTHSEISKIIIEAVHISKTFMMDAIPVRLIGINSDMMTDYIEYVADRLMNMLGYRKIYNKNNPFDFMKSIGLDGKPNFFETRPTEYIMADTKENNKIKSAKTFEISDDF